MGKILKTVITYTHSFFLICLGAYYFLIYQIIYIVYTYKHYGLMKPCYIPNLWYKGLWFNMRALLGIIWLRSTHTLYTKHYKKNLRNSILFWVNNNYVFINATCISLEHQKAILYKWYWNIYLLDLICHNFVKLRKLAKEW